jgi:hypothetical protein
MLYDLGLHWQQRFDGEVEAHRKGRGVVVVPMNLGFIKCCVAGAHSPLVFFGGGYP